MRLPNSLEGEWTPRGRRFLYQIMQLPPQHGLLSLTWVCEVLNTSESQLRLALTDDGQIGHNLINKYTSIIEDNGWPVLVLFSRCNEDYGVLAKNDKQHTMDIICKGLGTKAIIWSTSSGS